MFLDDSPDGKRRCHIRSTWRLFLRLTDKHGVTKTMSTPLKICNRHRSTIRNEHVLDNRTWGDVQKQMMLKCGFKPRKSRTELYYDRCETPVVEG
jgi:hypothetical protein